MLNDLASDPTAASLAVPATVVGPDTRVDAVEREFNQNPDLRAVVVNHPVSPSLIDRGWFAGLLAGPLGYGRMLLCRATVADLAPPACLVVAGTATLTGVALDALRHGIGDGLSESILVRDGTSLSVLSVSTALAHVARHYALHARRDAMTGLPNRLFLMDLIAEDVVEVHAVLHVDLDRFKDVNDVHGHDAGDQVITEFAARLRRSVRSSDLVVRLGGDEFAVVLLSAMDEEALEALTQRLVALASDFPLRRAHPEDPVTVSLGASVGVATAPRGSTVGPLSALLRHADLAKSRAKAQGRGRGRRYSDAEEQITAETERDRTSHMIERRLRTAIAEEALTVLYQPIVSLRTGAIVELEALVRWHDDEFGALGPDRFIPVAEASGLIVDLGRWVLAEACRVAATWPVNGRGEYPGVAVNLSAVELGEPDVVERVLAALELTGLPANRLCLEITETATVTDIPAAVGRLTRLREAGVRIALDDFGTGRSSLTLLQQLPLDVLKIDRSFTADVTTSTVDGALVHLVAKAAHTMSLSVCAEGIETPAQAQHAAGFGADRAQGWLFGRPGPDGAALHQAINETARAWAPAIGNVARNLTPSAEFTIVTGADGTIHFVSPGGYALLGREPGDVLGTQLHDLLADPAGGSESGPLQGADPALGFERILGVRASDGHTVWIKARGEAIQFEAGELLVRSHCQDITKEYETRQRLSDVESHFQSAFDASPVAMAMATLDGSIVRCNEQLATLLGYTVEAMTRMPITALTHPDEREQEGLLFGPMLSGRVSRIELHKRYLHADGSSVPATAEVHLVTDDAGRPTVLVAHVKPD